MNRKQFFAQLQHLDGADLLRVQMAYQLAKEAHRVQRRDGGQRYFEHPRDVALMLMERRFNDADTVIMALLHDVIEDTYLPVRLIANTFGKEICDGVVVLSKTIPIVDPFTGTVLRREHKPALEYWQGLLHGRECERLVKCSDRLVNHRDMKKGWPKPRKVHKAKETARHVLPIAALTDIWFYEAIKAEVDKVLQ